MGRNEKILGERTIHSSSTYDSGKHVIEWTNDAFHLHWRNMLFYLSKEEFAQFMRIAGEAYANWVRVGMPDVKQEPVNIGLAGAGGLNPNHACHPNYFGIEQLKDTYYHLHYRSLRMDLSKEELLDMCDVFEQAKKNLLNSGGKVSGLTTDEYVNSKKEKTESDPIKKFFGELNNTNMNYVVMRWFDTFPEKLHPIHNDIDIMVPDSMRDLVPKGYGFCQDNDIRTPNDGYYPKDRAIEMLRTTTTYNGIMIPNRKNYFLSLAYHALYHKFLDSGIPTNIEGFKSKSESREYLDVLSMLASCFGYEKPITLEYLHNICKETGWVFEPNAPYGVIHDKELLLKFIEKIDAKQ